VHADENVVSEFGAFEEVLIDDGWDALVCDLVLEEPYVVYVVVEVSNARLEEGGVFHLDGGY